MRTTTWNAIGKKVDTCKTTAEVLKEAKLDYTVSKSPILLPNGFEIQDKVATVKENGDYIGVVSKKYQVCQNEDAFNFVDEIEGLSFEKAGETKTGMIYIIGSLPDVEVLGDTFTPHLIMQNSHNGRYNLSATICPLRFVCQNQFSFSFRQMKNTVTIRHSKQLTSRMSQAKQLLNKTVEFMNTLQLEAEELAAIKVSDHALHKIVDKFFDLAKEDISKREKANLEEKRAHFFKCYNAEDNQNFLGTGWGVVNAMADFETHKKRKQTENEAESRFLKVTFDSLVMPRLIEAVRSI